MTKTTHWSAAVAATYHKVKLAEAAVDWAYPTIGVPYSDFVVEVPRAVFDSGRFMEYLLRIPQSELAAKFELVPGASLDVTNGWDCSLVEDRNRAWTFITTSVPLVVMGPPLAHYLVICRNLINKYI